MAKIAEARNKIASDKANREWKTLMKAAQAKNAHNTHKLITIETLSNLPPKKWEPEHFAAARKLRNSGGLVSVDHDVRFKFQTTYQMAIKHKKAKNFRVKPTQILCILGFVTFIILGLVMALASTG